MRVWKPKEVFSNGNSYEGELLGYKKDGEGVFTWASGNKYEGSFKKGNIHGLGK